VLRVNTFGRLHVRGANGVISGSAAQPRRLAILALLAAAGEQGLTRDKLLAYLWTDTEEDRARRGLNQALYALRQDLGSDEVFLGGHGLRLNPDVVSSDVGEFEQAIDRGRLEDAAGYYTGSFLDGFHLPGAPEFERWAEEERAALARCYAESLEKLAKRSEAKGDWPDAVGWWRKVAAQDPLNARVALCLMRALVAAGDRAGALQHARVYEVLMEQELDAPPDRQVVELAAELRRNGTAAAAAQPSRVTPIQQPQPVATIPAASEPAPAAEPASPPAAEPASTPAAMPVATPAESRAPPSRPPRILRQAAAAALLLTAGLAAGLFLRQRDTSSLVPGTTHRVAFDQQLELDPSLSPDGRIVAYAAEAGDRFELFVKQVRGGRAVPLTDALPGSHRRPQWSPDGSEIAFQSDRAIYLVDAFGGAPRLLVKPIREGGWVAYPAWSPDGHQLAYVEDWAIYRRPIDGGPARLISRDPAAHSLAWSPDGKWIAFVSGNPVFSYGELPWGSATNLGNIAPSSIWLVTASGGKPVRVTDAQSLNTSPVWLPNGRGLLFISDLGGSRDIYRVDLTRSGQPAASPARLTTGLAAHSISLSADADEIAYSTFTYTGNVWMLPIPSRGLASWAQARPLTEGTQTIEGIALSPDGSWLAFDSDRDGNQEVYKMPVAGGDPVRLTHAPQADFVSTWSRDGRFIALHSYLAGTRRVRLVSSDGGEPNDVVSSPSNQRSPDISANGRSLVFTADVGGQPQLFLATRPSGTSWGSARQLTSAGGWAGRWAPDGHVIVYCRADGLWLIAPRGGNPQHLVDLGGSRGPSPELALWGPDGRTIYYKAFDAAGRSTLWSIPATGGAPTLLVRFDDPSRPSSRPEFATDGKRFFFTIGARQSDIWAMELNAQR
jgi:Tol biopolymer transport system component/DNA-binding SARP family transcriptional activator